MRSITCLLVLLTLTGVAHAQIEDPVKWDFSANKSDVYSYDLHIKATIRQGWHIYAQEAGDIPQPTILVFTANPLLKLAGEVKEAGSLQKVYDKNVKAELKYYSASVDFIQKVTKKAAVNTLAKGTVTYVVCNDVKCLPTKEVAFSIKL